MYGLLPLLHSAVVGMEVPVKTSYPCLKVFFQVVHRGLGIVWRAFKSTPTAIVREEQEVDDQDGLRNVRMDPVLCGKVGFEIGFAIPLP